jgi:hypothetical protein
VAPLRRGVHRPLEDEANRLIRESLKGVTKHSDKSDILTPWKEAERYRREVYVASGSPERATRQGMFHRVVNPGNPELNSRDGISQARAGTMRALSDFVDENSVAYEVDD